MRFPSRLTQLTAVVAAALAGAAIVAAVGLARSGHAAKATAHASRVALRHTAHAAATKKTGLSVVYFRANSTVAPGEQVGDINVKCPKSHPRPVAGIFDSPDNSKVFLTASAPGTAGSRSWTVVAFNTNTTPEKVTTGVVCAK